MKNKIVHFYQNTKLLYILILGGVVGILLPAIITGYILVNKNQNMRLANLKFMGNNTLTNLSIALRGHLWDLREDLTKELIETVIMHRDIKKIEVYDTTSKRVFVSYSKPPLPNEHLLTFTKPITHNGQVIGRLTLLLTEYYVFEDIYNLSTQFIYIFSGQLVLSLLLIFFVLYYKVLKPLKRLNHQALHFANEDFSKRFFWSRDDEIGIVGKNFDLARESLKKAQEFSQNYKHQLQKEVEAKTKELQVLNENLEERVQLELEKNKKQNILLQQQTRLAALGEMMGNIAHQWRQPLSAITTRASALQLRDSLGLVEKDELYTTMDGVIKSANFLSQTIDDFRDFLRTDKIKKEFEVNKTIYDTFNIIKATYEANKIAVVFDLQGELTYNGYPNELSQVILNILNNAKDALVANHIDNKYLLFRSYQTPNQLILSVSDNAGGIPENIINKIFDPYFTTKHQTQGTGIGLYMSMQIIKENFNGTFYVKNESIEFENITYLGATFYIELPMISQI